MARVVSLFLPRWPTDRLRRGAGSAVPPVDRPLVLAGRAGSRRVVTALDAAAGALGLAPGMVLAKAQAMVPGLTIMEADPRGDAEALERLAVWALRFSPVVAADPPDGLVIDATGATHLHGGETAMLAGMVRRFADAGIEARAAIAATRGLAHAAARFSERPTARLADEVTEAAVRRLPIAALRLDRTVVEGLAGLGFERVGDVLDRPRAPLVLRFGPDLGRRLDQALGLAADPIDPVRPPDLVEARRVFAEPIGAAETIARHMRALAATLVDALEARDLGVRRLDLFLTRVDATLQTVRVGLARPSRDGARLARLLCDRIETIDPGFGIEVMRLAATATEPLSARQRVSSLIEGTAPDVSDLVDRLADRIGESRVYRFAPVASDVPERSVARVSALAPDDGATWRGDWPRPSRLLADPEPIETLALLPDHPPAWFSWRGVRRRVARADGPERVFGEWWLREAERATVRDYFRVEDDGGERWWIFRAGDGEDLETGSQRWFLHGIFA